MFQRILVPVDFGRGHERTLDLARRLARIGRGGSILLLHVIATVEGIAFGELERFYARLEADAREQLDALAKQVSGGAADGPVVECRVVFGDRVFEIVRQAREEAADLIVMTSHRVDPKCGAHGAGGFGTISYKVGILASCPVLLVK